MQYSTRYIVLFATAVCVVCSIFVAGAAVSLKDRQAENAALDVQRKIIDLAGLVAPGESLDRAQVKQRFSENVRARAVDLGTGQYVDEGVDVATYDQRAAAANPENSHPAPENAAKVRRIPDVAVVYHVMDGEEVRAVILPVNGYGLWSYLYGFLSLGPDTRTIQGLTFYEHGETPGLGGEVDNPRWKALWPGRKAYDDDWDPAIRVVKGSAPPPEAAPHRVDGLSGATITSRGVTNLLQFWLGREGYGPYLANFRNTRGI